MKPAFILLFMVIFMAPYSYAKRSVAPHLSPVERNGNIYLSKTVATADGYEVVLFGKNQTSGDLEWQTVLYRTTIDPSLERDVQSISLKEFHFENNRLVAVDERGTVYRVDADSGRRIEPSMPHLYTP